MKQTLLLSTMLAVLPCFASAETLNIAVGDVTYAIPSDKAGDMVFTSGTKLTILDKEYSLADVTSMYVDNSKVTSNTVNVTYDGNTAKVVVPGDIAKYLTVTVTGAHVKIIQGSEVGDATCGEITYALSGKSDDGEFYTEGEYKATLKLGGLTLTNPSGAPIDIENGKRIELSSTNGTTNTLTDAASGKQKACLVCKGHLELKGKGTLNINGNAGHGISAKEYVTVKNVTVNISSVKDGINCAQYFAMESGSLIMTSVGDDGIQVDYKDDTDREAEDTGSITISGGTISIPVTAVAAKALKAEGNITISGGTITASVAGNGKWDSTNNKTKASACIGGDADLEISGGTLNLTATGSGGKGISVDGKLHVTDGSITITTTGGVYAYVNGKEYNGYTGNLDNLNSDYKSSPKGMKIDGAVVIDGGTFDITASSNGGEGIESKSTLTINDGTLKIYAKDDAINSSSHMYINGGTITVVSSGNDGLDSNGNLYINGGTTCAFGASSPECGIDANTESGYTVIFTGGNLLAVGGSNSTPSKSTSTQAYVSGSGSCTANSTVSLKSGSTVLATFTVPEFYTASTTSSGGGGWRPGGTGGGGAILITCPGLTSGSSYTLTNGSSSSSVTARLTGSSSGGGRW